MASSIQQAIELSRSLDQDLSAQLTSKLVAYNQVADTLDKIRSACTAVILHDFEIASARHIEDRLWNAHQRVNSQFRSALGQFKNGGQWKIVERRKLYGEYLKFIKSSQRFYRDFIRSLARTYGVPELEKVAQKLSHEDSTASGLRPELVATQKHQLLLSCYRALIQLGDLSRYRETELSGDERDWAPAVGYYDLARVIYPCSGISHNQLAVIALADANLFRATYHLYRALSADEPHPQAETNLKRAFRNISNAWIKGDLLSNGAAPGASSSMVGWYLRLLSVCYKGEEFAGHAELENEVMSQLLIDLKQRSLDSTLHKLVVINIAAGHAAQERFQGEGESGEPMQSYLFFLRLNMRTFNALLQILQEELAKLLDKPNSVTPQNAPFPVPQISTNMQRVLPALRLYTLWLQKNVAVVACSVDSALEILQQKFWISYAKCLSLTAEVFPVETLSETSGMFEEDTDTIGFKPLQCDQNNGIWAVGNLGQQEAVESERDISREMLGRIRDLLVTGLKLAFDEQAPIAFDQDSYSFLYKPGLPGAIHIHSTIANLPSISVENITRKDVGRADESEDMTANYHFEEVTHAQDIQAQRMVDDLVGPSAEISSGLSMSVESVLDHDDPPTPPEQVQLEPHTVMSTSPFPVGTDTANVLLEAVREFSQTGSKSSLLRSNPVSNLGTPGQRSQTQSQVQSPALAQQALLSPLPGRDSALRSSPMPAPNVGGHSRVHSSESIKSRVSMIWMQEDARSPEHPTECTVPSHGGKVNLGNGTFGILDHLASSADGASMDYGMRSALLFGAANSPWTMTGQESKRLSAESAQMGTPSRVVMPSWRTKVNPLT